MTRVYLGLGSNQGDREEHLRQATLALSRHPDLLVVQASGLYESEYVGPGRQEPYLNACLGLDTGLSALDLLALLKDCEAQRGRAPDGHMRPRPLDLDILLFGAEMRNGDQLTLPHPRLRERAFVLIPLAEIAEDAIFPDSGETVGTACAKIRQKQGPWVRAWKSCGLLPANGNASKEDWRAALAVYRR